MWLAKRKWEEMQSRLSYLQGLVKERQIKPGFLETTLYADNEIYVKELRICVSAHDWYLLKKEPFFRALVRYGKNLNKRIRESKQYLDSRID